ncbi:MAG: nucleotidyltransferase domain-containing protein [Bacteroidetes bacterium]|nr:nucleotidyltransferase domain-containing protein [Fibrella sp.]
MAITYDPKPLTAEQLQLVSQDVKRVLTDLYGERLDRVILYGSYARGDFHAESDVDYMVVLSDRDFRLMTEVDKYWDLTWATWLEYGVWLSIKTVHVGKYQVSDLFFYRNVRREGIVL